MIYTQETNAKAQNESEQHEASVPSMIVTYQRNAEKHEYYRVACCTTVTHKINKNIII